MKRPNYEKNRAQRAEAGGRPRGSGTVRSAPAPNTKMPGSVATKASGGARRFGAAGGRMPGKVGAPAKVDRNFKKDGRP